MSLAAWPSSFPPPVFVPQPKRWTVDEFHQVRAEPWLEGRRLILVEGVLLEMPSPNPPHDASLGLAEAALRMAFGPAFWIRGQMALVLGQATDPVPDIAVVPGTPRDYPQHPRSAALVVEIAESSLAYDLNEKAGLYAAGGVPEYWVVDLVHRRLVVHRDPQREPNRPFQAGYQSIVTLDPTARVAPLSAGVVAIAVSELLP
jgi:Uma2 family endonuclease